MALVRDVAPLNELSILDVGCGQGGIAPHAKHARSYTGVELSKVAVERARAAYGAPNVRFLQMDATQLEFDSETFDVVVAREVLEHLPDPARCMAEMARVVRRGGRVIVSTPTRNSLHLWMNRALGHQDFMCSNDHVKEFSFPELKELIEAAAFEIMETRRVFLMPYWGIPGVDGPVRSLTDADRRTLELLRELGRRVGAEYAFCSVVSARRPTG